MAEAKPAAAPAKKEKKDKKDKTEKSEQKEAGLSEEKKSKLYRALVEDLLKRRFFFCPAFEIYGGVGGLYDYGPPGCAVKDNLMQLWRNHFVFTENMLEVSCTNLTPHLVLKTSGHVDKFTDYMVRDVQTQTCHRADKIIEEFIDELLASKDAAKLDEKRKEQLRKYRAEVGAYNQEQLTAVIKDIKLKAPDTKNDLTDPFPFNLMFETQIGPTGKFVGYLRPETAQGIFVNFRRLLEQNGGRMPFAAAQIGTAFRNEIAPRSGLLRVREFPLAEIEHFVNPNDKRHAKFADVANYSFTLFPRELQDGNKEPIQMTAGDAVAKKVINNETLAYFMARTHMFLVAAGIKPNKLRFRQHLSTEMAHYAQDCWDAEVHTTYGWVECVGHADRAAFDLDSHSAKSKVDLTAQEIFEKPIEVDAVVAIPDKGKLGKHFKADGKIIIPYLEKLNTEEAKVLEKDLATGEATVNVACENKSFKLTPDMVKVVREKRVQTSRPYTPGVIEPSFGVGRIMYAIFEHTFTQRDPNDPARSYLAFPPMIAPIKVAILPMDNAPEFMELVNKLVKDLLVCNLSSKIDNSTAALGRKYARADEIGTPFALTVDFESVAKDRQVTIRERDSTHQVRLPVADVVAVVQQLVTGQTTWDVVYNKFPKVIRKED